MTKLYPTCVGKLLLSLILPAVFTLSSQAQKMVTYDTTFGGWNAIVTEDVALQGNDSAAGIIFFPGIGQMDANIADLTVNGPHYLITNGLWDGSVSLGNGVHDGRRTARHPALPHRGLHHPPALAPEATPRSRRLI